MSTPTQEEANKAELMRLTERRLWAMCLLAEAHRLLNRMDDPEARQAQREIDGWFRGKTYSQCAGNLHNPTADEVKQEIDRWFKGEHGA